MPNIYFTQNEKHNPITKLIFSLTLHKISPILYHENTREMGGNTNLQTANRARNDEFYTQLNDIANELQHYKQHFYNKIVLCNCDDPFESNFFKYFASRFNDLHLKKLICTCWYKSPIVYKELPFVDNDDKNKDSYKISNETPNNDGAIAAEPGIGGTKKTDNVTVAISHEKAAYKIELTEVTDLNNDGATDIKDVKLLLEKHPPQKLKEHGDFRSKECIEFLKEADIVVTNPPFSLFREYVAQLFQYEKKFLIIGNQNAISYKEIFRLIKSNKLWLGFHSGHTLFAVPDYYKIPNFYDLNDKKKLRSNGYIIDKKGKIWRNLGNICWFTNLDHDKRHLPFDLYKTYNPNDYPKFDNYDAININNVNLIPMDYDGVMGVPISFLEKYCPEQFEIVDLPGIPISGLMNNPKDTKVNGKSKYARILIRRKQ